jgi:hypothetical protein
MHPKRRLDFGRTGPETLAAAIASSVALADQEYTDTVGDSQTAADIIGVHAANDLSGNVSFQIVWAGGHHFRRTRPSTS